MKKKENIELLFIKLFSDTASEEEINTVHSYVESSPKNRIYFQEMKNIWEASHPAFDSEDINTVKAYNKITEEIQKKKIITKINSRKMLERWRYVAAAVLIPLIALSIFLYQHSQNKESNAEVAYQKVFSPNGTTSEIILPDGSIVYLNAGSSLQYPAEFSGNQRNVVLTGEAYFQIEKDTQKPFIVHTPKMNIEVLGTKFNVNAYSDLSEVKTTLEEGKVKVSIPNVGKEDSYYYLNPKEELSLNVETGGITKQNTNASDIKEWFQGSLVFNSTLLPDVFKQIARKYNVQIDYHQSAEIAHKRLTVRFSKSENLDDLFFALQSMVPDLAITKQENKYHAIIRER